MVIAYHAIFTAYGFWLPNDPRGSWSDFVAAWDLLLAGGRATKTTERRSLAHEGHDHASRLEAKRALKYPAVEFTGIQALSIANGFCEAARQSGYRVHAASILPAHVHAVVARSDRKIEQVVGHLKARATQRLSADGIHPLAEFRSPCGTVPSPWAERCWKVFLDTTDGVQRAIRYVEENPIKEGKREQRWSFVTPFVPW